MKSLSYKETVKYLVFCAVFFLCNCSTSNSARDTSSGSQRGGLVSSNGIERKLTEQADKLSQLSWLSSKWCLKGNGSKNPANFYRVELKRNLLRIRYIGEENADKITISERLYHVEVNGNYFDLWGFPFYQERGHKVEAQRLEKYSDTELALIYKFKNQRIPGSEYWGEHQRKIFAVAEARKIRPEKYIKNPQVFVKCD
jgi:hypothetical protein